MNIIDILIARKKSFTGETETLIRQANEAMSAANEVASKIDEAENLLSTVQSAATDLENLQSNVADAAAEIVDNKINLALQDLDIDSSIAIEDNNTNSYKGKNVKISKG